MMKIKNLIVGVFIGGIMGFISLLIISLCIFIMRCWI